jgi:nucleoside-diphosphate-sugar epimerase
MKRILIIGASGFVGCRVAERACLSLRVPVVAGVNSFVGVGLARLARLSGVEIRKVDVTSYDDLEKASEGCDSVVNCAVGKRGSAGAKSRVTTEGARNLVRLAEKRGSLLKHVVHISTAAVQGWYGEEREVDEDAPYARIRDDYISSKIAAERTILRDAVPRGLPFTIFRPTVVYGPYSEWSFDAIRNFDRGWTVRVDGGRGYANTLYIDSLVHAILLALQNDASTGKVFLLNDEERVTWGDYYSRLEQTFGKKLSYVDFDSKALGSLGLRNFLTKQRISLTNVGKIMRADLSSMRRGIYGDVRDFYFHTPLGYDLASRLPYKRGIEWRDSIYSTLEEGEYSNAEPKWREAPPRLELNPVKVSMLAARSHFSSDRAKKAIGWSQTVSFDQGMRLTAQWLQFAGFVA